MNDEGILNISLNILLIPAIIGMLCYPVEIIGLIINNYRNIGNFYTRCCATRLSFVIDILLIL